MGIRGRKTLKFGPFRWHWTLNGPSSWSFRWGVWSWNSKTQRHRIDLPGPFQWVEDKPARRPVKSTKTEVREMRRRVSR